ncbi:hypothetical protein GW17_00028775 [Ensete ventricosum]|nr:hypothetical protein GW17_00028775 [Ensete ventricosum]
MGVVAADDGSAAKGDNSGVDDEHNNCGNYMGGGGRFGRCGGSSPGVRYEFAKGIGKLTGNILGDLRKMTIRLTEKMPEIVELSGVRSIIELDSLV